MALGTLFGGWRIVRTMGSRITRLKPVQGFCAETAGAMTLYLATALGVPVSTTHTITGAVMGVGAARRVSAVRWGIAGADLRRRTEGRGFFPLEQNSEAVTLGGLRR
jgi:inorganic phosphate transporter, PiT family